MAEKKIAIVLAGCGHLDGTDVHEASACALAVEKAGYKPQFYSFDKSQQQVYNHASNFTAEDTRNIFLESARIARGNHPTIQDFDDEVVGLLVPGGVGAVANTSNGIAYATGQADEAKVDEELSAVLKNLRAAEKPMAFISQAALLPAMGLSQDGVKVSFGENNADSSMYIQLAERLGAQVLSEDNNLSVDVENKIITSPGFLQSSATFTKVFDEVSEVVSKLVELSNP